MVKHEKYTKFSRSKQTSLCNIERLPYVKKHIMIQYIDILSTQCIEL